MWKKFDIVQLTTTRNIRRLSGPAGRPAEPQGNWSVVGNLPGTGCLILSKDETIIQIPFTDVKKIASYNIDKVIENVKNVRSTKQLRKLDKEPEKKTDGEREEGKERES